MDFRKIEYFLKVAETMNISRAAEQLHISHQGLSKQIRLLEEELGVALLERNVSGITLTETGKKLNEWFRPIANEASYRYQQLQDFIQLKKTTFKIGYFNALSYRKCVKPVTALLGEHDEKIRVDVLATDIGRVRQLLYDDMIDLAITVMMDPEDWNDVSHFELCSFPLQIIVSERHPWYELDHVTKEQFENGTMLYYAEGSKTYFQKLKVKKDVAAYNFDSYIGRLEEGEEFGVIGDIYSRREGCFRLLELPEEYRWSASVIAAYRKEHPLQKLLKEIGDELEQ